jgi:periplasmic protein TonB
MNAHALHLPEQRGLSRWMLAALAILLVHAAIVATIALWYVRKPPAPTILPAISVSLAPVDASAPEVQNQDIAVGPTMQQAEAAPNEPPKQEQPVEKIETPPPPQQQADVTLPKETPKQVEEPKPQSQPPAPETRAPPKTEHIGQFTQAASNAYNALVFGHLQRFKRYPAAARGASGTVIVQFELDREGKVLSSSVNKSSGNTALDHEALEILQRASPFPAFPTAKPGTQEAFLAPVAFAR